jgi:hypothetical protein
MKNLKFPVAVLALLTLIGSPSLAKTAAQIQAEVAAHEAAKAQIKQNELAAKNAEKAALERAAAAKQMNKSVELENKLNRKFK